MLDIFWYRYLLFEECFRQGGILMIPLLVLSSVMWVLIVERCLFLHRLHRKNMPLSTAAELIRDNRLPDPEVHTGAISILVARFIGLRSGQRELDRFILDESVLSVNHSLTDHLTFIGALASVAPLLGLLGTVTGMIGTFEVLSVFGTGNAKAMAGGISEALITTQTGLLVAIPGLYMYNFLRRRATNLQQRVAAAGLYLRRQL